MSATSVKEIPQNLSKEVTLNGWMYNKRSSGSIAFLQFRDGSGNVQCVVEKDKVGEEIWKQVESLTIESSIQVTGKVKEDKRSSFGFEIDLTGLKIYQIAEDYPIQKKEHGPEFLLDNRHLWLRSTKQAALMRLRASIVDILQEFYNKEGFHLIHTPSFTPTSCEGGTELFELDYFGEKAYLTQNGQMYLEAACMSLGKVYDLNPNFRAEKSKTRRHLTEFWALDPEIAFYDLNDSMALQEKTYVYLVQKVLERNVADLEILERDIKKLEPTMEGNFPRIRHSEAVERLQKMGSKITKNDDLGADDEKILTEQFDRPIFVSHYPLPQKFFYFKTENDKMEVACNADMLAPEGVGEIIGGGQREDNYDLLIEKAKFFKVDPAPYQWYFDLRKYGSVPHSGYGIGIERTVRWISGIHHIRETVPFPRMINRITP